MRVYQKILSLCAAVILLCGLFTPVIAAVEGTGFSDVAVNAWYAGDIIWCRENKIMNGTTSTSFSPDTTMSRAMLATVLYRAEGSPTVTGTARFPDVAADAYYNNAAVWASANGYISGYTNGRFGSDDPVTREDIATILWRYADRPAVESGEPFADQGSISNYAVQAVNWARANGIVGGVGGNRFDPKGAASRAQVAAILHRFLTRNGGQETPDPSGERVLVAYFSRAGENYNVGTVEKATPPSWQK